MRITTGTIILAIVLAPFIVYLVYAFTGLLRMFNLTQTLGEVGDQTFDSILSIERSIVGYLYSILSNPTAVALIIGAGLVIAALEYRR